MTGEIVVSEKKILKFDMAVKLAQDAIADRGGDFLYIQPITAHGCLYVHDDEMGGICIGCFVGHILVSSKLISIEKLKKIQDFDSGGICTIRTILEDRADLYITDKTLSFLVTLQTHQDDGRTWSRSLLSATRKAEVDKRFYDRDEAVIPHFKNAEEYNRYNN